MKAHLSLTFREAATLYALLNVSGHGRHDIAERVNWKSSWSS